MYRILMLASGSILFLTALVLPSNAATLFSYEIITGARYSGFADSVNFQVSDQTYPENPILAPIFADEYFTVSDVGKTITITQADDPNFADFTNKLTNGISDSMVFWFCSAPNNNRNGSGFPEARFVWGNRDDPRIDLHGYNITSYSMTLKSLSFHYYPDGSSEYITKVCFSAEGYPVPEPSTIVLLGMGSIGSLAFAWRWRGQPAGF